MLLRPAVCTAILAALLGSACFASDAADDIKQEMTAAVEAVRPALVRIYIVAADYRQGRELKVASSGSGVIISSEGYAVTNHHVAMDAERITCTLADKREVDAKLVGADPLADIAVIKLVSPDGKPFPFASFGDSSKLEVGDRVFAMGSPLAISQSVTMGIVSNVEMVMPGFFFPREMLLEGEDVGSIVRWIGHDALIRPGNSGGPLVGRDGKIVGINEISIGLAGAIPSNLASRVADQLVKQGKVIRSWIGIGVQPLLESSGMDKGILVSGVLDGSPAQKAGFASGDVILSLAGREVTARFREEVPLFNQFVADLPVGKPVEANVMRGGKQITLTITTAERQKAIDKQHEIRSWGICGTNITYLLEKEMQLDSQDGAIVTGVLPSGPAGSAKPPLQEGDVIIRVRGEKVADVAALREITRKIAEGHKEPAPVLVDFRRRHKQYATVVRVGNRESPTPSAEISKAWLPVSVQVITRELAPALGVAGKTGVRVTQVYPTMSAPADGLRVGDLIVKLDGEAIPAEQDGDEEVFASLIRQYDIGAQLALTVIRDGKPLQIKIKLQQNPKLSRDYPKYENDSFEFTARDIAFADRADGDVAAEERGAYVESVAEGGWASLGDMQGGDVIVEIDASAIANLASLRSKMTEISGKKPKTVVLKVRRGIHTLFLEVEPDWSENGD